MHHGDVAEAVRRAAAGWTAEDIARSMSIDLDDVRVWMLTLAETQRVVVPVAETPVPDDFSPVRLLRQLAASEVTPPSVRVRACGMLLQDAEARARIDWMAVKVDDIPPEARPALAGALAADVVAGPRVGHEHGARARKIVSTPHPTQWRMPKVSRRGGLLDLDWITRELYRRWLL